MATIDRDVLETHLWGGDRRAQGKHICGIAEQGIEHVHAGGRISLRQGVAAIDKLAVVERATVAAGSLEGNSAAQIEELESLERHRGVGWGRSCQKAYRGACGCGRTCWRMAFW